METNPKYYWVDRLNADQIWGRYRFKRLEMGHFTDPDNDVNYELIDIVDFTEFVKTQKERLPVFIGNFSLTARSVYIDHPERRIVAIRDLAICAQVTWDL